MDQLLTQGHVQPLSLCPMACHDDAYRQALPCMLLPYMLPHAQKASMYNSNVMLLSSII